MADLPDWTTHEQIKGTDVQVAMDIQGAYVMVPVDIQGQTMDVKVDIDAQTIGNLAVNIVAQAVGNLLISVAAQTVGVFLQPEWTAQQGTDKDFIATGADFVRGTYALAMYTVTAGKTLTINSVAGLCYANLAADGDKEQICSVAIYDATSAAFKFYQGGNGGVGMSFPKPLHFAAGHQVWFMIFNWSNHNCNMSVIANGYEG